MNKGLEVIEAKWLFNLQPKQIDVVVHPQSIVHSLVQFTDGSLKAQLGLPDMKLPIQYALGYPERIANKYPRFSFAQYPTLSFEAPDTSTFTALGLAFQALEAGKAAPCILNAANEIAVAAFLNDEITFLQIAEVVADTLSNVPNNICAEIGAYLEMDKEARAKASSIIQQKRSK